jgi:hypothetical protein
MVLVIAVLITPVFAVVWQPPSPSTLWNDNFYVDPSENEWSYTVGGSSVFRNDSAVYYSSSYSFYMNSYGDSWAYVLAQCTKRFHQIAMEGCAQSIITETTWWSFTSTCHN